jgi:signal transduction histidine kinase
LEHSTVLVISDDVGFSRRLTARWQAERHVPTFTILSGDLWPRTVDNFEVAIVGPLRRELLSIIVEPLHSAGRPLFCACEDAATVNVVRDRWPRAQVLLCEDNWPDVLIMAAGEAAHRAAAETRARIAEQHCAALERQAMLGRYVLEMRHGLNNALTSLLGNSDLLLQEPGSLSAQARGQIETIRNMTLRIHEVMQRFSSLEKELNVVALQAERESVMGHAAVAAGD